MDHEAEGARVSPVTGSNVTVTYSLPASPDTKHTCLSKHGTLLVAA